MFWARFQNLCESKKKSPNGVSKELGFSSATATSWKNGTIPNGSALQKIADYFDVSVDYLLGRTGNPGQDMFVIREDWSIGLATEEERIAVEAFLTAYRTSREKEKREREKITRNRVNSSAYISTLFISVSVPGLPSLTVSG